MSITASNQTTDCESKSKDSCENNLKSILDLNINQQTEQEAQMKSRIEKIKMTSKSNFTELNNQLIGIRQLNGTKLTGKLVAVRRANGLTLQPISTTSANTIKNVQQMLNLASNSSSSKSGASLLAGKQAAALCKNFVNSTSSAAIQRIIYTSSLTNSKLSEAQQPFTLSAVNSSSAPSSNNMLMNTSKPIILQMKRKMQLCEDETCKTRMFTTLPATFNLNSQINLMSTETNHAKRVNNSETLPSDSSFTTTYQSKASVCNEPSSVINSDSCSDTLSMNHIQPESRRISIDNLIMDECAAAMVLMSLSYSPNTKEVCNQSKIENTKNQKVVFQCTWRNCGQESIIREQIEQHVRQMHLGIIYPNDDHEEDFYYTEIDVHDSAHDSSGISSAANSPQQSAIAFSNQNQICNCQCKDRNNEHDNAHLTNLYEDRIQSDSNKSSKMIVNRKATSCCKTNTVQRMTRLHANQRKQLHTSKIASNVRKNCKTVSSKLTRKSSSNTVKGLVGKRVSKSMESKKVQNEESNQVLQRGLEWSVRKSASAPINIPGVSLAHINNQTNGQTKNNNKSHKVSDINYSSSQFNVGSVQNTKMFHHCMAQKNIVQTSLSSSDLSSSCSPSSSSSYSFGNSSSASLGLSCSIESNSIQVSNSHNFSSDNLFAQQWLSSYSNKYENAYPTPPTSDEIFEMEIKNEESEIRNKTCNTRKSFSLIPNTLVQQTKKRSKCNLVVTNKNGSDNLSLLNTSSTNADRLSRLQLKMNNVKLAQNNYTSSLLHCKPHQAGFYANLHRGTIQPAQSLNSTSTEKIQSNTNSTNQLSANRRTRNVSGGKCRKKYGMEKRDQWCVQCRWKKACSRVDPLNLSNELDLSSNGSLIDDTNRNFSHEQISLK